MLQLSSKAILVQMHSVSRLLYNAHTWAPLTQKRLASLEATYAYIAKRLLPISRGNLFAIGDGVLYTYGAFAPLMVYMRRRRLQFLGRLFMRAQSAHLCAFFALMGTADSRTSLAIEDLI